jgi:carbamoyltransferase
MMGAAARQIYPYELVVKRIKQCWDKKVTWHKGCTNISEWNIKPEIHPEDVPTAAQAVYEEKFETILKSINNHKLNNGNIVYVGGCALNVSANRFLSNYFSNIYIPSNPGDSGSAIGCILARARHHINPTPYLGYDIQGPYPTKEIIDGLMMKRVVGVANGKCEFGPRALGNRTLFGDPKDLKIKDKINEIKGREPFRPFAPMILPEDVPKYFNGGFLSPYMSCALEATEEFKQKYPGVVHLDGTSRLQVVDSEPYITLLNIWKDITKCPVLLNTSLNVKGQPIVNTREDAEAFTKRTGVNVYS